MQKYFFLSSVLFLISCGGGGGGGSSVPFAITFGLDSFSVNEDTSYSGSLSVSANETVTLNYSIVSDVTNGTLSIGSSGSISYQPRLNFNGVDQFTFSVTAVEKNVTKQAVVNITVNEVNDMPTISLAETIDSSNESLRFENSQSFKIFVDDVDNEIEDLSFSIVIGEESLPASFTPDSDYQNSKRGSFSYDLSSLQTAGFFEAQATVSDSTDQNSLSFSSWFVSNKEIVTIEQDDDPEDGFEGGDNS